MSLLLEACLNYACGPQQIAVGLAGLIKLGDIVSDIFFILDLKEWHNLFGRSWMFDGEEKANYRKYLIAAVFFTAVGITYDLCMCYFVVRDRQKKNTVTERIKRGFRSFVGMFFDAEEGKDDEWIWWKHFNLVIEEIPQLIILLCFFTDYYRGCEYCTDEQKKYMYSLYISAVVSTVFTCLTIIRVSGGAYRAWHRKRERQKQGMLSALPTLSVFGSDKRDKGKMVSGEEVKKKMKKVQTAVCQSIHVQGGANTKTESKPSTQKSAEQGSGILGNPKDAKINRPSGQIMTPFSNRGGDTSSDSSDSDQSVVNARPGWNCVVMDELKENFFFWRQHP